MIFSSARTPSRYEKSLSDNVGCMRAYKFFTHDRLTPFMGSRWDDNAWMEVPSVERCHQGFHACRADQLSYWMADSLWEVELGGEIEEGVHKVVASRARLVRQIEGYRAALAELSEHTAFAARDAAVKLLRADNDRELADQFAAANSLEALFALRDVTGDSSFARIAAGMAADVADDLLCGEPAQAPFVACCLAGHLAARDSADRDAYETAYDAERMRQSQALAAALGLS